MINKILGIPSAILILWNRGRPLPILALVHIDIGGVRQVDVGQLMHEVVDNDIAGPSTPTTESTNRPQLQITIKRYNILKAILKSSVANKPGVVWSHHIYGRGQSINILGFGGQASRTRVCGLQKTPFCHGGVYK